MTHITESEMKQKYLDLLSQNLTVQKNLLLKLLT